LNSLQEIDPESEDAKEMVQLVFNTASLSAGYVLDNAAEYSQMVIKLMTKFANK
jgi:HSP90 family molecular chaperone